MENNKIDLIEIIAIITWIILGITTAIILIIAVYGESKQREEKECWNYYLKNKVILTTCEKWIKEEEK